MTRTAAAAAAAAAAGGAEVQRPLIGGGEEVAEEEQQRWGQPGAMEHQPCCVLNYATPRCGRAKDATSALATPAQGTSSEGLDVGARLFSEQMRAFDALWGRMEAIMMAPLISARADLCRRIVVWVQQQVLEAKAQTIFSLKANTPRRDAIPTALIPFRSLDPLDLQPALSQAAATLKGDHFHVAHLKPKDFFSGSSGRTNSYSGISGRGNSEGPISETMRQLLGANNAAGLGKDALLAWHSNQPVSNRHIIIVLEDVASCSKGAISSFLEFVFEASRNVPLLLVLSVASSPHSLHDVMLTSAIARMRITLIESPQRSDVTSSAISRLLGLKEEGTVLATASANERPTCGMAGGHGDQDVGIVFGSELIRQVIVDAAVRDTSFATTVARVKAAVLHHFQLQPLSCLLPVLLKIRRSSSSSSNSSGSNKLQMRSRDREPPEKLPSPPSSEVSRLCSLMPFDVLKKLTEEAGIFEKGGEEGEEGQEGEDEEEGEGEEKEHKVIQPTAVISPSTTTTFNFQSTTTTTSTTTATTTPPSSSHSRIRKSRHNSATTRSGSARCISNSSHPGGTCNVTTVSSPTTMRDKSTIGNEMAIGNQRTISLPATTSHPANNGIPATTGKSESAAALSHEEYMRTLLQALGLAWERQRRIVLAVECLHALLLSLGLIKPSVPRPAASTSHAPSSSPSLSHFLSPLRSSPLLLFLQTQHPAFLANPSLSTLLASSSPSPAAAAATSVAGSSLVENGFHPHSSLSSFFSGQNFRKLLSGRPDACSPLSAAVGRIAKETPGQLEEVHAAAETLAAALLTLAASGKDGTADVILQHRNVEEEERGMARVICGGEEEGGRRRAAGLAASAAELQRGGGEEESKGAA